GATVIKVTRPARCARPVSVPLPLATFAGRPFIRLPIAERIRRRHRRADLPAPCRELFLKFPGLVRHLGGEVVLFAEIRSQVVQLQVAILEKLDQLPITRTNGPGRRGAPRAALGTQVSRKVPVNRLAMERLLTSACQQLGAA